MSTFHARWTSIAVALAAAPALFAHAGHDELNFAAGAAHPVHGLDHMLAMIAVGLLAVRAASPGVQTETKQHALWQIPSAFMGCMLIGGMLALIGVPVPGIEWAIALSVLVFGVLIALATPPHTSISCLVVGSFALLHGHAHVAEMAGAQWAAYGAGFLITTAALHTAGIVAGWWLMRTWRPIAVRWAGVSVAVASLAVFAGLALN